MTMAILDDDMKRLVEHQRSGRVAAIGADAPPTVWAEDSLAVWGGDILAFTDQRSPAAVRDLVENPAVEIDVVDPASHAGWHFEGRARVLLSGPTFERARKFFGARGVRGSFEHVVFVDVQRAIAVRARTGGRAAETARPPVVGGLASPIE